MILVPGLNDVFVLTKTKSLIWRKVIDTGWSHSVSFGNCVRSREYESEHENFRFRFRAYAIGKKRPKMFPELTITNEDPALKITYGKSSRLLRVTDLILKTSF